MYIIKVRTKIPGHFGHKHVRPLASKRYTLSPKKSNSKMQGYPWQSFKLTSFTNYSAIQSNQFEYEYQLENNHLLTSTDHLSESYIKVKILLS